MRYCRLSTSVKTADSELLANGLTEELFGTLERNRELRVTARSSAFQFKEQNRDVRDIGQRLGVRYVLEGSVRRNADHVQVQAELVDIETGTPLWTETYDRALADWFALQQDIAVDVARAVQRVLQERLRSSRARAGPAMQRRNSNCCARASSLSRGPWPMRNRPSSTCSAHSPWTRIMRWPTPGLPMPS